MPVDILQHLADMPEVLRIPSLRDFEDEVLRVVEDGCHRLLLGIRALGNLPRRRDQLAQDALFLDDARVVLDIQRVGNRLRKGSDVVLPARLIVHAARDQHINQGHHVNLAVCKKQFLHGKVNLLMLFQIEVLALHQRRNLVQRRGVDQNRAQKRLFRRHGERQALFNQFVFHSSLTLTVFSASDYFLLFILFIAPPRPQASAFP